MALNKVIQQARIPFDLEIKNGDDEKKAFLGFTISVKRNYKAQGEEYYPEDLLYCKAFGQQAIFINKYFSKGSDILIEGELRRDDDYEKDGQTIKGQMYIHIIPGGTNFVGGAKSSEGSNGGSSKKSAPAAKPAAKTSPLAKPGAKLNPLKKKLI